MQLLADQLTAPTWRPTALWGLTTTHQSQQPLIAAPPANCHSSIALCMASRAVEQPLVQLRPPSWLCPAPALHHRGGSPGCAPLTQQQTRRWLKPGRKTRLRFFSVWGRIEKKKEDNARLRKLPAVYTACLFVSTARDNSTVSSQMLGQWEKFIILLLCKAALILSHSSFQRKALSLYVVTSCINCSNCT